MKRSARSFSRFALLALASILLAIFAGNDDARAADIKARVLAAEDLTIAFEYEAAAHELDLAGAADDPDVMIERARLALHQGNCDDAAAILMRPAIAKLERAEEIADVARGCVRATAAVIVEKDEAAGVEVKFQDEHDRVLFPLLVDTVVKARETLTKDLGATWPKPTRIVMVRDALTLSVMTGLPYTAAQTTGTVAVAKWGRVTMLSPRASHHGYPYRDTLAHELTHLAVTRITHDRAPLWMQEGLAKREETRWRPPSAFDGRPTPEAIVSKGIEKKLDLPLDKLGLSLALLPSPEAALVAYSEVVSFVGRLAAVSPDGATLVRILAEMKKTPNANDALKAATGQDLATWDKTWRTWLAEQPKEKLPSLFGMDAPDKDLPKIRDHVRLAQLLLARGHAEAALVMLDKVREDAFADPDLRSLKARALAATGKREEAAALLHEPKDVVTGYGPWWSTRAVLAHVGGDEGTAEPSFAEAVALDPFSVEGSCRTLDPAGNGATIDATAPTFGLCEAARAWIQSSSP